MKKVILYGVGSVELRRDAEYFMDDEYEIVGYSDSHYSYDSLDGAAFYPPEALCHQPVDYVVLLAFQESVLTQMREYLLSLNVCPEKIIAPTIFLHRNAEKYQLDLIQDICLNCHGMQGLIFGLSYSQRDICIRSLEIPFYDCSWSSLDLYYNYRIFQYMEEHQMLTGVKLALLVFPYNYFDYDMSLSPRQYENGRIFSTWRLDDWHHYEQVPAGRDYVANYRMFGKKVSSFYHLSRYEMQNRDICQMKVGSARLENLWFHSHTETVHENIELFSVFLRGLIKNGIAPALIVPPFFLNALDPESKEAYSKKKYEFYQIIQHILPEISDQIRVFDYAGVFADRRELFMDLIHLNTAGAEAFTQIVNRDVVSAMIYSHNSTMNP